MKPTLAWVEAIAAIAGGTNVEPERDPVVYHLIETPFHLMEFPSGLVHKYSPLRTFVRRAQRCSWKHGLDGIAICLACWHHVRKCIDELAPGEVDWRPTHAIAEDFYA